MNETSEKSGAKEPTVEQRIDRLIQATLALHGSVREWLRRGPREGKDTLECATNYRVELVRAATAITTTGIEMGVKGVEDDSVLGRAMAFLAAEFAVETPTIVTYPGPLGEPTEVDVEKLKEQFERYNKSGPRCTPQEGGWK